jgi:hypothetical protein
MTRVEFELCLRSGRIFYFGCAELNSSYPHFFICIFVDPSHIVHMSCCTSQFETVQRLIERRRYPEAKLIYISDADADNPFDKPTYINCNEYFQFSIDELWEWYLADDLTVIKELLPLHSFEQILLGFQASNVIEEEIKDQLPSLDSL